jgi:hypothetical protein
VKYLALALAWLAVTLHAAETEWKAGAAKAVITPKEPMWMAGYASRKKPAEGTAQDLFAKALALEDAQGKRFVFITLDLLSVPRTLRADLEKRFGDAYHLPPEGFVLNVSHTHCGPEYRVDNSPAESFQVGPVEQADAYGRFLEETIFKLVGDALSQLAPAKLTYHHARCGFAMNRRLPVNGMFANSPYPDGPVDQDVPVLRVSGPDDAVRAILFGYACHNTTLQFYQWCGDYAGYAQEALEVAHPGAIALFVQGCAGDQNPYPRSRLELAKMHGQSLATAVDAALSVATPPLRGPLLEKFSDVALDFVPTPTREELEERLKSTDKLAANQAQRFLARLDQGEKLPTQYPYPVQVVRFGDGFTFVGLAGETVVGYSLRIKRELPGAPVWVAGYCNDVMTYIPTRQVLEEGGYEGRDAMKWTNLPGPWAPTIEERIVGEVHSLLGKLGK